MSRILLLVIVVLWLSRSAAGDSVAVFHPHRCLALSMTGFVTLIAAMALWSRFLARSLQQRNIYRSLRRFQQSMFIARMLIPVWFGIAIFALGWGALVDHWLSPLSRWPLEFPGMLLGAAPALLAWIALAWAQYPADRSLREQTLFYYLDEDLPIHAPPGLAAYFASTLRLQVLFTLIPVAMILFLRDCATIMLGYWMPPNHLDDGSNVLFDLAPMLLSIGAVVLVIPEVLRRVLNTESLPDSPLRQRLDELCRRTGLRYRDILLWKTDHFVGNAAVMGLIPQVRYILLSDVLLETMTERQIEAVFAHELGHVKHWHLGWYVVLVKTMILLSLGPGQFILGMMLRGPHPHWMTPDVVDLIGTAAGFIGFIAAFGFISRWFERQADLFAARTMEPELEQLAPAPVTRSIRRVGPSGAAMFASALQRVALVNNIPLAARNFTHGSIADRVNYLQAASTDPIRVHRFDRSMGVLYAAMGLSLIIGGLWVVLAAVA